jgi:hypothetical protein
MTGYTHEPQNLAERAADAGMSAIHEFLGEAFPGAEAEQIIILLRTKDGPSSEPDSVTAGHNVRDARDLLASVMSYLIQAAAQVGLEIQLVPVRKIGQG